MADNPAILRMREQLDALRIRLENQVPTLRWDDITGPAHDRAFAVAGAAKADILADFAQAVQTVITEGQSLEWFRQQFDAIVERHGWAYTGARNWRTRVIYTTNLRSTYAAGRLAQLRDPDLQRAAPLWMYRHGGSADPRPEHLAWDRLVLPADDPWWQTHYPPNGWGCTCRVVAVSRAQAQRQGGRFESPPPDEKRSIDPGWDHMPGDRVDAEIREMVSAKADSLPAPLGDALRADTDDGEFGTV